MEYAQIKELIALINATEITEFEIERDGFRMRVAKQVTVDSTITTRPNSKEGFSSMEDAVELIEISAPMVGVFYTAPAPNLEPYVQIGEEIQAGQVLFVIEAMKMMNEIVAERPGVIRKFLVENGQAVEYGQPLLLIEPES